MSDHGFPFPDSEARVAPLLAVADLDRSVAFWVGRLGAVVEEQWDTYARLRIGTGLVHLALTGDPPADRDVRLSPPEGEDAWGEVVLHVGDCRDVVARLQARGVQFLGEPSTPPWGGEVRAFAKDPDGHLIEISSPLAGD